jgi:hypothetical protein
MALGRNRAAISSEDGGAVISAAIATSDAGKVRGLTHDPEPGVFFIPPGTISAEHREITVTSVDLRRLMDQLDRYLPPGDGNPDQEPGRVGR